MSKRNRNKRLRLENRSVQTSVTSTLENPNQQLIDALSLGSTHSGVYVNPYNALSSSTVLRCVQVLSHSLAMLPLYIYRNLDKGKQIAKDHPLYSILQFQPNPEMSSFIFREMMMMHLLLRGNAYAEIEFDNAGRVKNLWPIYPDFVLVRRDKDTGAIVYDVNTRSFAVTLPAYRMLHIKGMGDNGLMGRSLIAIARDAIGLTLATEEFSERFYSNNAKPSGFWGYPAGTSNEKLELFAKSIKGNHEGLSNQHRTAVVEDCFKFNPITISQQDSQYLQTRQFQVAEICRIFGVPPTLVYDLTKATYSNIEQASLDFVIYSLMPWLIRFEQEFQRSVIQKWEQQSYFIKFDTREMLRGDLKTQSDSWKIGREGGWLSINDIREMQGLNPIPKGGDDYIMPLNFQVVGEEPQEPATPAQPAAPPQPTQADQTPEPIQDTPVESKQAPTALETRSSKPDYQKVSADRVKLRDHYKPLFRSAGERVTKRVTKDLKKTVREHFNKRSDSKLDETFAKYFRDNEQYFRTVFAPVLESYFKQVAQHAGKEVNQEFSDSVDDYVQKYLQDFAYRYQMSHTGQLQELAGNSDDPLLAIEDRLDEWDDKDPGKIADNETVQSESYMAKSALTLLGVTRFVWSANAKCCPLCEEMNGKTVGTEKTFLSSGDKVEADGADTLTVSSNILNPPLHGGCSCSICAE